jgi:hypothetical protein
MPIDPAVRATLVELIEDAKASRFLILELKAQLAAFRGCLDPKDQRIMKVAEIESQLASSSDKRDAIAEYDELIRRVTNLQG